MTAADRPSWLQALRRTLQPLQRLLRHGLDALRARLHPDRHARLHAWRWRAAPPLRLEPMPIRVEAKNGLRQRQRRAWIERR